VSVQATVVGRNKRSAVPAMNLQPTAVMSDYRRWYIQGGTFFLTVVTYSRRPILTTDAGRGILHSAIETVRKKRPFDLFATVLLPDHWHLIIRLPAGDFDYSTRIQTH
jgi:putative transposase